MKINYTMVGTGLAGGSRVLLEIANRLVDLGHEVTITSLGSRKEVKWFPLKANVTYIDNSFWLKALNGGAKKIFGVRTFPFTIAFRMTKSIPECDINVATYWWTAFSVFLSEKGKPFYHMQHYEPLFYTDHFRRRVAEETYYLPLNKIVNSSWLKNQMKEKHGYDLPVVNPAIDHIVFYPREVDKDTDKMRIVCFGKQHRWKGFPEALKSMKIVMKKRSDVEFAVYGANRPSYETDVRYKFVKCPSDNDLARLYSSADVVICPSWYESFPLPPIEAMACGAPVVTTRYGSEDYAFNEENCLVIPPKDSEALADAILRLLDDEDLRERFRKEGPKTAANFTWDKTVCKIENLFKKAC